jgi:hypothetical protein
MPFKALALVATFLTFAGVADATVIYGNLANPLGVVLGGLEAEEIADDVTLGPGPRTLESVRVAYAGFNFDGDETLTLNLYAMDGPPTPGSFGFDTPGTLLYSATAAIVASPGTILTFVDPSGSVVLPDIVAIGLVFAGIDFDPTGLGSDAGPVLYDPPNPGSSFGDFWMRGVPNPGDPWGLHFFDNDPRVNFGAEINAVSERVPEPTVLALLAVGLSAIVARRRNSCSS